MKKVVFVLLIFVSFFDISNWFYDNSESIKRFINSPSYSELEYLKDLEIKYCEEVFLDAYRRRDFSEEENFVCRDIFSQKIEDELNYKKSVLKERWVY